MLGNENGMNLEQEILDALSAMGSDTEASGSQITHYIEDHSPKKPWQVLWWHGEAERIIGFGTMYRALDRLVDRGLLTRTRHDDVQPPRFTYRLNQTAYAQA